MRRFRLSERGSRITDPPISWLMERALQVPGLVSLAAGFVDHETLPYAAVRGITDRMLSDADQGRKALQYGTTCGDPDLRDAILKRLAEQTGAAVYSTLMREDVIMTNGSQQFLYMLAEVLLDPGDIVIVEDPSYFVYVGALQSFGARLWGVPTDADGIIPEALDEELNAIEKAGQLGRVKMIYVMTYFQNPMSISLSAERRPRIWDVLNRWEERGLFCPFVEDAAYRELRFDDEDVPAMFELQPENRRVCYTQTFSKALSPGMRLGYGIAPPEIIKRVAGVKAHHDFGTSNLCQQLALHVMRSGLFDEHIVQLRKRYQEKSRFLTGLLQEELHDSIEYMPSRGGLYLWVTLPEGCDTGVDSAFFNAAMAEKVLYVPGELCAVPCGPAGEVREVNRRSLRLCHAFAPDSIVEEGARRLCRAVKRML